MAKKRINELQLIDTVEDTLNIAGDDGTQTYRATLLQVKNYCISALSSAVSTLQSQVSTLISEGEDLRTDVDFALTGILVGEMKVWPVASSPSGFLLCDGQEVSRVTYANLFSVLGTTWGVGDGTTTFNLPDMRGKGAVGAGTSVLNGRSKVGPAVGSYQEDQMQKITGIIPGISIRSGSDTASGAFTANYTNQSRLGDTSRGIESLNFDSANSPNARVSSTTDGQTRITAAGVNWIIKF